MLARSRPKQRSNAATRPDFELYKPILEVHYVDQRQTRAWVAKYMKENHGFQATKYQYETAFNRWGWFKNMSSQAWDCICPILHARISAGQAFEVFYYGKRIEDRQVQQEIRRRSKTFYSRIQENQSSLPQGVAILSPPIDLSTTLLHRLPFRDLQSSLPSTIHNLIGSSPETDILTHKGSSSCSHQLLEIVSGGRSISTSLRTTALVSPLSCSEPMSQVEAILTLPEIQLRSLFSSIPGRYHQLSTIPFHQAALLSIANNFVGLGDNNKGSFLHAMEGDIDQILNHIQRSLNSFAKQAVVHNLFRTAIQTGNAKVANALLVQKSIKVDVNAFIYGTDGERRTPIEEASGRGHRDLVETLLNHRAIIDRTFKKNKYCAGALCRALHLSLVTLRQPTCSDQRRQIASLLFAYTVDVHLCCLFALVEFRFHDLLLQYLRSRNAQTEWKIWYESGLLRSILKSSDETTCTAVIGALAGADFDFESMLPYEQFDCGRGEDKHSNRTMLELIVSRGFLGAAGILLQNGASATVATLFKAVNGKNEEMVSLILQHMVPFGVPPKQQYRLLMTVIRKGEKWKRILKVLVDRQVLVLEDLTGKNRSASTSRGVVGLGVAQTLVFLVQHGLELEARDSTSALSTAILEEQFEPALQLIRLGVAIECFPFGTGESPLLAALIKQNEVLMTALLDHGADPSLPLSVGDIVQPVMCEAVRWGNLDIIQKLLDAGADINPPRYSLSSRDDVRPLAFALQNRRSDVTEFLLRAGADVNSGCATSFLAIAVSTGSSEMVCLLLEAGADPYDEGAVKNAIQHGPNMYDTILAAYKARYPYGHFGFGSRALVQAIESQDYVGFHRIIGKLLDPKRITDVGRSALGRVSGSGRSVFSAAIKAAISGNFDFVTNLLQQGCSPQSVSEVNAVRQTDPHGCYKVLETAFLLAVATGNMAVVRLFINYNADVNYPATMRIKRTPLQKAAECGHLEIARMLIRSGADVHAPGAVRGGATALQLAAIGGHNEIIELLLSYGADVNAPAGKVDGRTALEGAAEHGRLGTVAILLHAGAANRGQNGAEIESAMRYAEESGFPFISDMLKDYCKTGQLPGCISPPISDETSVDEYEMGNRWDERAIEIE